MPTICTPTITTHILHEAHVEGVTPDGRPVRRLASVTTERTAVPGDAGTLYTVSLTNFGEWCHCEPGAKGYTLRVSGASADELRTLAALLTAAADELAPA